MGYRAQVLELTLYFTEDSSHPSHGEPGRRDRDLRSAPLSHSAIWGSSSASKCLLSVILQDWLELGGWRRGGGGGKGVRNRCIITVFKKWQQVLGGGEGGKGSIMKRDPVAHRDLVSLRKGTRLWASVLARLGLQRYGKDILGCGSGKAGEACEPQPEGRNQQLLVAYLAEMEFEVGWAGLGY